MEDLIKTAEQNGIEVSYGSLPTVLSCSAMAPSGRCYIGLDYSMLWDSPRSRVHAAHELGHCMRGAFYNIYSPYDDRARQETRATRWAVKALVPLDRLREAVELGYRETWELAEYFSVTPEFMATALKLYSEIGPCGRADAPQPL